MVVEAFRRGWAVVSSRVPKRVRAEGERFLECGDVRRGFVEVACGACREARLVAFSCKGRGWCPSCTTRRAVEAGAHAEAVLPRVAHRQWTLSLPMGLRYLVVTRPALLKRLEVRLVQAVWRRQRRAARQLGQRGTLAGGAVCFGQYFGSRLQLTPHLHCLVPEAMWTATGEVVEVPPPTDDEVVGVLRRVLTLARRDFEAAEAAFGDEEDEYGALQAAAVQRPLALGDGPTRRRPAKRVAVAHGFSLHADTAVHGHDRQGLERLARYGARGPLAESRLRRLEDGRYEYTPKRGEAFVVTAEALVKRLVALTPPARKHLTSFHGVYGPNARLRPVVMQSPAEDAAPPPAPKTKATKPKRPRLDWATLHRRTFGTDVLRCPCGGRRTVRRLHLGRKQAEARLAELGHPLPSRRLPPETAPPQLVLDVA